jgi:hypothetical protein
MQVIVFISHVAASNRWQIAVVPYGERMARAQRRYFQTLSDAVDAATNLNPVRIVRTSR